MGPPDYSGFRTTRTWLESHEIKKNSVVTGIESTTSGLLDERRSPSDNQAPCLSVFKGCISLVLIRIRCPIWVKFLKSGLTVTTYYLIFLLIAEFPIWGSDKIMDMVVRSLKLHVSSCPIKKTQKSNTFGMLCYHFPSCVTHVVMQKLIVTRIEIDWVVRNPHTYRYFSPTEEAPPIV